LRGDISYGGKKRGGVCAGNGAGEHNPSQREAREAGDFPPEIRELDPAAYAGDD